MDVRAKEVVIKL